MNLYKQAEATEKQFIATLNKGERRALHIEKRLLNRKRFNRFYVFLVQA